MCPTVFIANALSRISCAISISAPGRGKAADGTEDQGLAVPSGPQRPPGLALRRGDVAHGRRSGKAQAAAAVPGPALAGPLRTGPGSALARRAGCGWRPARAAGPAWS